jgi:hypothetical protein
VAELRDGIGSLDAATDSPGLVRRLRVMRLPHTGRVPDAQTYGDRRPYAVPDTLAELTGPVSGHVVLPAELGWTGRTDYDLDDPSDAAVLYERILVDAVRAQDITRLVNAGRLRLLWSRLFLPARVRRLWESRFPSLTSAA